VRTQVFEPKTEMTNMKPNSVNQILKATQVRSKRALARLVRDESGQSMTEYILILAMVLMIFSRLKKGIMEKVLNLVGKVGGQMDSATEDSGG